MYTLVHVATHNHACASCMHRNVEGAHMPKMYIYSYNNIYILYSEYGEVAMSIGVAPIKLVSF